jgi:hypothetical protein
VVFLKKNKNNNRPTVKNTRTRAVYQAYNNLVFKLISAIFGKKQEKVNIL